MENDSSGGKPELLLVAASARFLAESAAAGGYAFSAVDGFADAEVRSLARCSVRVPFAGGGFDGEALRRACSRLIEQRSFTGGVIGPGLDTHTELIEWLSSHLPVYANASETFALCRNGYRFVQELRRLGIPHPSESDGVSSPALVKFAGPGGGAHVRFTSPADTGRGQPYRQTYRPGTAVSHLFIAGAGDITSIGWNTQWQSRHDERQPFCYGGAVNRSPLTDALRVRTEDYAARLAREFALAGINSADYVVCGGDLYLLELNPRISATMQLHEDEAGALFTAHIDSHRSFQLPSSSSLPVPQMPRAHAVMYAPWRLTLPRGFDWPAGTRDLPDAAHSREWAPGEPVCTLGACAKTTEEVLMRLQGLIRSLNATFVRHRVLTDARPVMRPVAMPLAGGASA